MAKPADTIDPVFAATNAAFLALKDLPPDDRTLAMKFLADRFGIGPPVTGGAAGTAPPGPGGASGGGVRSGAASGTLSPKDFMLQKRPQKHIERIACLAYYLTHLRDMPSFKTKDLTALNTEARQPRFTSASMHVNNAVAADYLTSSGRGFKAITTRGEALAQALPDREKVKEVLEHNARVTRRRRRKKAVR